MITDYSKQTELVNVFKFNIPLHIIGCGAGGSWLTFFLLKMGFKNIHVYDFDVVEEHNLPNQMFMERHIGQKKVEAMQDIYNTFFDDNVSRLTIHDMKVAGADAEKMKGFVFSCVDSMATRKRLYEAAFKKGNCDMWIEGRMGLWGAYIYTLTERSPEMFAKYEETLYDDEEAEVSACGVSQTALPSAANSASLMISQMLSAYRGNNIVNEIRYQMPDMMTLNSTW